MPERAAWGKWRRYGSIARRDAHEMLEWGYRDAKSNIRSSHDEADITGLITDAIKRRLGGTAPARFNRYSVADDSPQSGEDRTGISRRRVDIIIETTTTRPRLHYIFEAKRLRHPSHPLRTYLGPEGLLRFVRGVYASDALEAAMVGYVQSSTVELWGAQLAALLSGSSDAAVVSGPDTSSIIPGLPYTWVTTHTRVRRPNIVIFHILLDCRVEPDLEEQPPSA